MRNQEIIQWIFDHKINYPGDHYQSHSRIFENHAKLEPKKQFKLIINETKKFIARNLNNKVCVNVQNFGIFILYNKLLSRNKQISTSSNKENNSHQACNLINEKEIYIHFQPCTTFYKVLMTKKQVEIQKYDKKYPIIFLQVQQISTICMLNKQLINNCIQAYFKAIIDLTELEKQIQIDIALFKIIIKNKHLTYKGSMLNICNNQVQSKNKLKNKANDIYESNYQKIWDKNILGGILKRPNAKEIIEHYKKGTKLKLKLMKMEEIYNQQV